MNLVKGKKTIGCKWIFTTKYRPDGSLKRYKAHLVPKEVTQIYNINYQEPLL